MPILASASRRKRRPEKIENELGSQEGVEAKHEIRAMNGSNPTTNECECVEAKSAAAAADPREEYLRDTVNRKHWSVYMSAMIKSIRAGDAKATVYWGCLLDRLGKTDRVWTRILIHMNEDIGPAERTLPANIMALYNAYNVVSKVNMDGAKLSLVNALILLATAKKTRVVDDFTVSMYFRPMEEFSAAGIPDSAFDVHTKVGKELGRDYDHFFDVSAKLVNEVTELPGLTSECMAEIKADSRRAVSKKEAEKAKRAAAKKEAGLAAAAATAAAE